MTKAWTTDTFTVTTKGIRTRAMRQMGANGVECGIASARVPDVLPIRATAANTRQRSNHNLDIEDGNASPSPAAP